MFLLPTVAGVTAFGGFIMRRRFSRPLQNATAEAYADECTRARELYMREFAKTFYKSQAWKNCREAYAKSQGGLCERCRAKGLIVPGVIVHHKVYLTPENISDTSVSLNFDHLELLCRSCHEREHRKAEVRYKVDKAGRVIID